MSNFEIIIELVRVLEIALPVNIENITKVTGGKNQIIITTYDDTTLESSRYFINIKKEE